MTTDYSISPQETSLTAGGSDPEIFDWQEVWYPVHYLEDLDQNKPTAFTLLERDIVIWRTKKRVNGLHLRINVPIV